MQALDSSGVALSLSPLCPLDGTAGPYAAAGPSVYPDGTGTLWRLDFGAASTAAQQQSAVTTLASLTGYTPPQTGGLSPYRLSGSVSLGATLAVGTGTVSVPVAGLLRTDTPMIAFGQALPPGVDIRAEYPDPGRDGTLVLQVAVLSALTGAATVPFTLIGVR